MNDAAPTFVQPKPNRFIVWFGVVVVVGVVLYFLFMLVDGTGLANQEGAATVQGKEYREAGTTYATQRIGNRTQTIPQTTAEMYILYLEINGTQTWGAVDKKLYEGVRMGDRVKVVYQQRRITGNLQVLEVTR